VEKKLEKGGGCERQRATLLFPDRLMCANGWGESLLNIISVYASNRFFVSTKQTLTLLTFVCYCFRFCKDSSKLFTI